MSFGRLRLPNAIRPSGSARAAPPPGRGSAGRGSDRLTWRLSRDLRRGPPVPERPPRAAGRPGAGCGTPQVIICCSSGGLCLRRRMIGCCLSRSTVRAGFHRAGRRWQRDKPGSLAVIGIALGWVTVGRGEWRPRAGAGVPQRAPGRASYCILRWWGCGLGRRAAATCVARAVAGPGYWPAGRPAESAGGQITVAPAPRWPEPWAEITGRALAACGRCGLRGDPGVAGGSPVNAHDLHAVADLLLDEELPGLPGRPRPAQRGSRSPPGMPPAGC